MLAWLSQPRRGLVLVVKKIENFISRTQHFVKDETNKLKYAKPIKQDVETLLHINGVKMEIDKDLENDFDTSSTIKKIMHLIDVANVNDNDYSILSLIYNYVIDITNMFGLKLEKNDNTGENVIKLVKVIENFRNNVRDYAKINKQGGLFKLSDGVRDELTRNFGIDLIDDKAKK